MAAYIGKIEAFDETIEPWSSYVERLEQYFKANKVDDSLKVASLSSLIGGKTYNLLRILTSPTKHKRNLKKKEAKCSVYIIMSFDFPFVRLFGVR
jgi:hypothetical protein